MDSLKDADKFQFELTQFEKDRQENIVKQVRGGEYKPELSALQEEYMAKAMVRQKEGIVKPQVVAGREFKGTSFISKPEAIIFKDFTVGVSHTQTILFTNVSFSFNSFKLLPLEDNIKDFFHIQYTPTGRMSAGLSTTITITFTPQLNQDINSFFPILSETGRIDIPLVCTCKKALISVEEDVIDFGNVIFGEQATKFLKLKNAGALATKVFVKTNDGRTIPFFSMDDLRKREERQRLKEEYYAVKAAQEVEEAKKKAAKKELEGEEGAAPEEQEPAEADPEAEAAAEAARKEREELEAEFDQLAAVTPQEIAFEEFLAQVSFKRTAFIEGYSELKIQLTFVPYKLTDIDRQFTLFLENQDYTEPIPIAVRGQCVDVPIYVEKEEYDLNVLIYDQFYRQKITLFNRSSNSMKIQLFFPKDFKPYLEFNPTLGYIQSNSSFAIWLKFKPDRSILTTCNKYLVRKEGEEAPTDPHEEFTMRIPIKVVGANQVLPVKFSILCCYSVNAVTFKPPQIDFGNVFNENAAQVTVTMENHSLLPQRFSFVRLPKEITVKTDAGTGTILPGEKYDLDFQYRPSQAQAQDESFIYCRLMTGEICAREVKIQYLAQVSKCPIVSDKRKIEFPALPETEFAEVVLQLNNQSQKEYVVELVPPLSALSGLTVNPLVKHLEPGRAALVQIKYDSDFRDLSYHSLDAAVNPRKTEAYQVPDGMVAVNKRLAARIAQQKTEAAEAAPVDPKGKKAPPPAAKKEEPAAKKDAKGGKGAPTAEEEQAEAERRQKEKEEAARKALEELENKFDKTGELARMGGKVFDFDAADENRRTQHYDWLIPIFYRTPDAVVGQTDQTFLQVRTTTVKRSLVPNLPVLEFGEIPVAVKQTQEILVKNVGLTEETMRMEPLTPFGGFSVLNALRTIKPGETKSIVVQFEPAEQQIYEERLIIYSATTMVSVLLKGVGVRPEVSVTPEDGLLSFSNILVGETAEKSFAIKNVSSFSVNFNLVSLVAGVDNISKEKPFLLVPSGGTIEAHSDYTVKIIFQPDHESNNYFDVMLIDIPNQVRAKKMFLRGWAYSRQFFAREYDPFVSRPESSLRQRYEEPLKLLALAAGGSTGQDGQRRRIYLEFSRDEDVAFLEENDTEKHKNRTRTILIGNCRLLDAKMEKAGTFEITAPATADKYFDCDNPKGQASGGQEHKVNFSFTPPQTDELLKDIKALKGIGQWVENVWELKLMGGFVEPGQPDPVFVDIVLRAYVEQI